MISVVFCKIVDEFVHVWVADSVGKTSLILALVSEEFPEEVSCTNFVQVVLMRGVQKVRSLTQLTIRYAHRILSLFNTVSFS